MFNQLLLNSLIAGSTYALIALSFSLIYSTTKFFHFAHGAVYTFCPYFAYLFTIILGMPLFISIPLAIISSAIVGILTESVSTGRAGGLISPKGHYYWLPSREDKIAYPLACSLG